MKKTEEGNMGKIYFNKYMVRLSQMTEDIINSQEQEELSITYHNTAHRKCKENKIQIVYMDIFIIVKQLMLTPVTKFSNYGRYKATLKRYPFFTYF